MIGNLLVINGFEPTFPVFLSEQESGDKKEEINYLFPFFNFELSGLKRSGVTRKGKMGARMRKSRHYLITYCTVGFVFLLLLLLFVRFSVGDGSRL